MMTLSLPSSNRSFTAALRAFLLLAASGFAASGLAACGSGAVFDGTPYAGEIEPVSVARVAQPEPEPRTAAAEPPPTAAEAAASGDGADGVTVEVRPPDQLVERPLTASEVGDARPPAAAPLTPVAEEPLSSTIGAPLSDPAADPASDPTAASSAASATRGQQVAAADPAASPDAPGGSVVSSTPRPPAPQSFPNLADVPQRPADLPTAEERAAMIQELQSDAGGALVPGAAAQQTAAASIAEPVAPPAGPPVATILFAQGSAAMDDEALAMLGQVAAEQRAAGGMIRVLGRAGDEGDPADGDLALQRARMVADALTRQGADPARIAIAGVGAGAGESRTGSGGDSARRAEIYLDY